MKTTTAHNSIRQGSRIADVLIYLSMGVVAFITLYPLYYVLILSVSNPQDAASLQVYWFPKGLYLDGYAKILQDARIWRSYRNTLMYAAGETALMLAVCSTAAYALSHKRL